MFERLREDIACILKRDPAARSKLEIVTCYPGFHAILVHRMAHFLWHARWYWLGRFVSHLGRILTGIEIHPGATLGRRVFIDHGHGVVIGETAEVGDDCTIYQGVTLGGTKLYKGEKRHPTLGKRVVVGAGAQVLGGFTVGDDARIGSNAVVVKPVPAGATAVGNPARIIEHQKQKTAARASQSTGSFENYCSDEASGLDTKPLQDMLSQQSNGRSTLKPNESEQNSEQDMNQADPSAQNGFTAYAVGPSEIDPLVKVVQELIDHTARQDARINQLCHAIESLGKKIEQPDNGLLDAERLNKLVE